ncbi:hypothetical protein E4T56_gene11435 [Termitomyces sp. T112]|nr:hypothetical protein E4T56_gene11435 [Termitomyces sp. T112]
MPLAQACSSCFIPDPTSLCLVLNILLNASSQTQPHFVWLGPQYSTQCFIPDPTSLCSVRSLYFKLNAKS